MQTKLIGGEKDLHHRVDMLEKENINLRQKNLRNPVDFESLGKSIAKLVSHTESELIDFINGNYQTFTEKDITELFEELQHKIKEDIAGGSHLENNEYTLR
jgi:hypothetical protein